MTDTDTQTREHNPILDYNNLGPTEQMPKRMLEFFNLSNALEVCRESREIFNLLNRVPASFEIKFDTSKGNGRFVNLNVHNVVAGGVSRQALACMKVLRDNPDMAFELYEDGPNPYSEAIAGAAEHEKENDLEEGHVAKQIEEAVPLDFKETTMLAYSLTLCEFVMEWILDGTITEEQLLSGEPFEMPSEYNYTSFLEATVEGAIKKIGPAFGVQLTKILVAGFKNTKGEPIEETGEYADVEEALAELEALNATKH